MDKSSREWRLPLLTLVTALALSILPLPDPIDPLWPDWVALVLIYWSLDSAPRFGLLTAFFAGLMIDTLSGALLGQHALALLIVVYLSQRFYLRFRVFPVSQMTITVVVLLALHEFVLFWADGMAGRTVPIIDRWGPVLGGALVWPLLWVCLDRVRRDSRARI